MKRDPQMLFERCFALCLLFAAIYWSFVLLIWGAAQVTPGGIKVTGDLLDIHNAVLRLMQWVWDHAGWIGFAAIMSKLWDIESRLPPR